MAGPKLQLESLEPRMMLSANIIGVDDIQSQNENDTALYDVLSNDQNLDGTSDGLILSDIVSVSAPDAQGDTSQLATIVSGEIQVENGQLYNFLSDGESSSIEIEYQLETDGSQLIPDFSSPSFITTNTNDILGFDAKDIDGDGDIDLASASRLDNRVAWYDNDGLGNFTQNNLASLNDAINVKITDLDGDGDQDIVASAVSGMQIRLYRNDGNQDFSSTTTLLSSVPANFLDVGDVDGDGDVDIVYGSQFGELGWLANDGAGNMTNETLLTGLGVVRDVAISDVDNANGMDILFAARAEGTVTESNIGILFNDGSESFATTLLRTNTGGVFAGIDAIDVNNDGTDEIVATDETNDKIYLYQNVSGSYVESEIATCLDGPQITNVVDLNGDGNLDLLISGVNSDNVAAYQNTGDGTFVESIAATGLNGARNVLTTDLDGDAELDVVVDARFADGIAKFEYLGQTNAPILSDVATLTVEVLGVNDAAVVSGDLSGTVKEDVTLSVAGIANVVDPDQNQSTFQSESIIGQYGQFSIQTDGSWEYILDNSSPNVQALSEGEIVTDEFTLATQDGTEFSINVQVEGSSDDLSVTVGECACDGDGLAIYVTGSSLDDKIDVKLGSMGSTGDVFKIKIKTGSMGSGMSMGSFKFEVNPADYAEEINKIVVYGLDGNDDIKIHGDIENLRGFLFGGAGDDKIKGGKSDDVIVGGAGDDKLTGHNGRDIVIGGTGADKIKGDKNEDILIAGSTDFDNNNFAAFCAIMDEWTRTDNTFQDRVNNIYNNTGDAGRLNNDFTLINSVTLSDGAKDDVKGGGSGADWFILSDADGDKSDKLKEGEAFWSDEVSLFFET